MWWERAHQLVDLRSPQATEHKDFQLSPLAQFLRVLDCLTQPVNLIITDLNGVAPFRFLQTGSFGIGGDWGMTTPSTTLHISGTLRLANGGEACDANRTGAIRYTSGEFSFCRNGTAWEALSSIGASGDRITQRHHHHGAISATGFVSLTQAGTNTGWVDPVRGLVTLGVSATGAVSGTTGYFASSVGIGIASPQSSLDVSGPIQWNSGASRRGILSFNNSHGIMQLFNASNGVGAQLWAQGISFFNGGSVGIGTSNPSATLHVSGTMRVGGGEPCTASTIGNVSLNPVTGRLQLCDSRAGPRKAASGSTRNDTGFAALGHSVVRSRRPPSERRRRAWRPKGI